ncbi:hypothetical protein Gpo141_00009600, partial [Globisporangium polare]
KFHPFSFKQTIKDSQHD